MIFLAPSTWNSIIPKTVMRVRETDIESAFRSEGGWGRNTPTSECGTCSSVPVSFTCLRVQNRNFFVSIFRVDKFGVS